jgi:hypothetical protein
MAMVTPVNDPRHRENASDPRTRNPKPKEGRKKASLAVNTVVVMAAQIAQSGIAKTVPRPRDVVVFVYVMTIAISVARL